MPIPETDTVSTTTDNETISVVLGDSREKVNISWDVSGAATLTVETREQGGTWRTFDEDGDLAGGSDVYVYDSVTFYELRATINQNVNHLEVVVKGQ